MHKKTFALTSLLTTLLHLLVQEERIYELKLIIVHVLRCHRKYERELISVQVQYFNKFKLINTLQNMLIFFCENKKKIVIFFKLILKIVYKFF